MVGKLDVATKIDPGAVDMLVAISIGDRCGCCQLDQVICQRRQIGFVAGSVGAAVIDLHELCQGDLARAVDFDREHNAR